MFSPFFTPLGRSHTRITGPIFSGVSSFADGLVGTPAITFTADADTGLYRVGANSVGVTANGTLAMTINTTGLVIPGTLAFTAKSVVSSPADGQLNVTNAAATAGVGFDLSTDGVCKLRTRAQSAYATLDALAYKVSGTAGADFGPGAVTSITVVKGIVTAIS